MGSSPPMSAGYRGQRATFNIMQIPAWDVSPLVRGFMSPSPNQSPQVPNSPPFQPEQPADRDADLQPTPDSTAMVGLETEDSQPQPLPEDSPAEGDRDGAPDSDVPWFHPIPSPSEPRQYRAIGLVRGCYKASDDQFTQGILQTVEGIEIDAVLLGRVMSLVKKHVDLEQEHLWVVYPRTRQKQEDLHVQIMGIWEPETLKKDEASPRESHNGNSIADSEAEADPSGGVQNGPKALPDIEHGYFSIRGEVVYQSQDENRYTIIKIRQSSRKENEKPKFFKLKLSGLAGLRPVGHFWDLHARLAGNDLVIEESHDIGSLAPKRGNKPFNRKPRGSFSRPSRPDIRGRHSSAPGSPVPKPVPRKPPKTEE